MGAALGLKTFLGFQQPIVTGLRIDSGKLKPWQNQFRKCAHNDFMGRHARWNTVFRNGFSSPLKKARRRIFERNWCDLEAGEPRISGIFEVSPTKRACRFRQKDEDANSSTGC